MLHKTLQQLFINKNEAAAKAYKSYFGFMWENAKKFGYEWKCENRAIDEQRAKEVIGISYHGHFPHDFLPPEDYERI